jgi:hypothetical protein
MVNTVNNETNIIENKDNNQDFDTTVTLKVIEKEKKVI